MLPAALPVLNHYRLIQDYNMYPESISVADELSYSTVPAASSKAPKLETVLEQTNLPAPVKSMIPLESNAALNVPPALNVPVPISSHLHYLLY